MCPPSSTAIIPIPPYVYDRGCGPEKEKLVRVAREAVEKGLQEVKPWGYLGDGLH
ncbi:MAG: hypothetical protein ACLTXS_19475 [[Clostridium] symbiosum]